MVQSAVVVPFRSSDFEASTDAPTDVPTDVSDDTPRTQALPPAVLAAAGTATALALFGLVSVALRIVPTMWDVAIGMGAPSDLPMSALLFQLRSLGGLVFGSSRILTGAGLSLMALGAVVWLFVKHDRRPLRAVAMLAIAHLVVFGLLYNPISYGVMVAGELMFHAELSWVDGMDVYLPPISHLLTWYVGPALAQLFGTLIGIAVWAGILVATRPEGSA